MNTYKKVGSLASNRHIVLVCLFYILFSSYYDNQVEGNAVSFKEEDIEIEKQLNTQIKSAVITIKSKHGDLYDCVDFYKQPAFDHPMLQNHSFNYQMKPSWTPEMPREEENFANKSNQVRPMGLGCPFGTVPIRLVTNHDLIRAKLNLKTHKGNDVIVVAVHYAQGQTIYDPNRKYNGGGATLITTEPPEVHSGQYSSARVKLSNGSDSIEAGWTVNPDLYGDATTRLYLHTETSGSECFNVQCPGFVLVNDFPFDVPIPQTKGDVGNTIIFIYRDVANGNWWLEYQQQGSGDRVQIGFWPQEIFSGLRDSAGKIEYGGEVLSPQTVPSPPMGNGVFLKEDLDYDAYLYNILQVNEAQQVVDADNLEDYCDVNLYQVKGLYFRKGPPSKHIILYGGSGGAVG